MSAQRTEHIINEYLDRVVEQLSDLSPAERAEIRNDLRSHIDEAIGDPVHASEADVRNVLERLGSPQELAQAARERSPESEPLPAPPAQNVERRINGTPGALEVAAIVLTVLFWPIGILLAWISDRWLTRDKVIATVIPVVGTMMLGVVVVGGMIAWGTTATTTLTFAQDRVQPAQPASPGDPGFRSPRQIAESPSAPAAVSRIVAVMSLLVGLLAAPFIAGVYLAIRLKPVEEIIYPDGRRWRGPMTAGGHARPAPPTMG